LAHQNSQTYDTKKLEDLQSLWRHWNEPLEKLVSAFSTPGQDTEQSSSTGSRIKGSVATVPTIPKSPPIEPIETPEPVAPKKAKSASPDGKKDGRRPVVLVDEATRLFNKDYFSECLAIEVERAKRYSRNVSLLFLSVSPVQGGKFPANGDEIANQVAEILSKSLRKLDFICRVEDGKFGVILPDTPQNTYGVIAKRVFKYFKQIMGDAPPVFLNISASSYPKHASTHHELLENAEQLLAQAKEVGPNKAVLPE
jgi:diguanylate cyclase (GGDEF)-like protein